ENRQATGMSAYNPDRAVASVLIAFLSIACLPVVRLTNPPSAAYLPANNVRTFAGSSTAAPVRYLSPAPVYRETSAEGIPPNGSGSTRQYPPGCHTRNVRRYQSN